MITLADFFSINRDLIFFLYGLGFFVLGLAILLQIQQSSRLELARSLRWLAAFAITHALNEWGDLFIPIQAQYLDAAFIDTLAAFQIVLLGCSFAFLFEFGISVLRPFNGAAWMRGVPAFALAGWLFIIFFILLPAAPDMENWHHNANALSRYLIGFPGGLLAAYGLRVHAIRRIQPLNVPVIFNNLQVAGLCLGLYAFLAGLIPPPVDFFPGNILNAQTFEGAIGVPTIVFRTLLSIVAAVSIIRSLEVFRLEAQRRIESLEQQQIIAAEHERLARELHDGAIQKVYTAGLLVESAARHADPASEMGTRLERAVTAMNDAIADLRHNLADLRHSDSPSEETIEGLLRKLEDDPHYNSLVNISLDLNLPPQKSLPALRTGHVRAIVNEALANVARHANARNVTIQARDLGERLQIAVRDDGVGFSPDARPGYGLRNMRDRARLLNGDIHFSGSPGKGTSVTLEIPWTD
ncbi:MAG: ATP-binding protein [Chloroflexota bacterium]